MRNCYCDENLFDETFYCDKNLFDENFYFDESLTLGWKSITVMKIRHVEKFVTDN